MSAPAASAPPRGPGTAWALVVIVAILAGAALYVFRSARELPRDVARDAREALSDLRSLAAAFRNGNVTTSFRSYATELRGATRLQFATLRQLEVFERRDALSVLWGQLELPDVIVEARAPVEYAYYLDLEKDWSFRPDGPFVSVLAPRIEWNAPALDISSLELVTRKGSLFRDEESVKEKLRASLREALARRAEEHVVLVREEGRRRTEAFVERWLVERFDDGAGRRARVVFPDEAQAAAPIR